MFYKKVNKSSRKEMVEFLENHFRYDTMNSWNCSTSYANCVKIYSLNLPNELMDKAWELVSIDNDFYDDYVYPLIYDFREEWGYDVCFNGKSSGYLVLYEAEKYYDEYKKYYRWKIYPGKSIDMGEDFNDKDEWSMNRLKERVELVQAFDKLCDDIRDELIWYLETHDFVDEEYTEVKTRKVAKEIEA